VAKTVLAKYSPEKYLLSHCTIIAAVDTELADPKNPKSDWLIHPAYSKFVNNNGDAWTKTLLSSTYRTFIGANNYLEHVQIPELSKGKVIDAVLREVVIGKNQEGKDLSTYYVDILVATERKHKDLVRKIESGEMNSLSMGCKIAYSICTKCGNKAMDEAQSCQHVRYEKNNTFYDQSGVQRKVAELCGHPSEPESVTFIDASWVANPAFTGAVIRNVVNPPDNVMAKIKEAEGKKAYEVQELDFLKAAYKKNAKDEPLDIPPEGEEPPVEDIPPPAEDTPPVEDTPPEDTPPAEDTGDVPVTETPAMPEESPIKTWKKKVKQQLMEELGDEIVNEFTGEDEDTRPYGPDNLDESLIKPTASLALKQMHRMKKSWDRYLQKTASHYDRKSFDKLKYGTYMILTSNDLSVLKDYGYNRRDFLAVMSFLDRCFKNPLDMKIKKAIALIGHTRGQRPTVLANVLAKLTERELTAAEIKKALVWLKAMDSYGA